MKSYEIIPLIASSPNIAKNTDPTLIGNVMTIQDDKQQYKEPLLYAYAVNSDGDLILKSYTLQGIFVKQYVSNNNVSPPDDLVTNETQGFVVETVDKKQSAAGSVFTLFNDDNVFIYGVNTWLPEKTLFKLDPSDFSFKSFSFYGKYLYATTSTGDRNIDVFDFNFNRVEGFLFTPTNVPENYQSVNVKVIDEKVYVVYAPSSTKGGIVNVYNLDGTYLKTLINDPTLVIPWGIVKTRKFGKYSCTYLVGNRRLLESSVDDFTLSIYDKHGVYKGKLKDKNNNSLAIEGLRSLNFYDDKLYYAASTKDCADCEGLATVGYIRPSKNCHQ